MLISIHVSHGRMRSTVKEVKNAPAAGRGRGGEFGRGGGRGDGYGRGRGGGYNRDSRNNGAPANENGYGGGYRRSEEGDGAGRGGPVDSAGNEIIYVAANTDFRRQKVGKIYGQ